MAPYLSGVEVSPYNAEADTTVSLSDPMNGNTAPIRGEEIDKIDEAQKNAETQKRIESLQRASDFAGGILLHMYVDDQERRANEASGRESRYVPDVIVQKLDIPEKNSDKSRLQRFKDGLLAQTITKDPQAMLWKIPGLERKVDGATEHLAVAANLTHDVALPVGNLMVIKGDITRPAPGVPVEAGESTEAFRNKFPKDRESDQLDAYFEEPENNFRTLHVEAWKPAGQTWDGDKIKSNSSFDPEEIQSALRDFWVQNKLGVAGQHFGFQIPRNL